ncbi:conserved hypothetical protein [Ignisphaera aggregans DSM 17230]|uniref:CdvA-like coiled-coil domain-containing protein n=1 Tax=Ignisphaera aggregans (strain DSM 17230 / JCM 13409 / AQ1.S1) TaxID=583356 RepID=E0SQZ2_IGNAA|nr:conserved hypothetical protein [Ignisphaera aggregans DSM 17230]
MNIENVANYLGQTITDIYGRKIGVITSIYSDVDGKVTSVEIMTNDAIYETIPAERLELGVDGLKLLPEWLVAARALERKLDVLRKRIKAMEELYKKGQIPTHAYREIKEKLSKELDKAKVDVKNLKEVLRKRTYELENFVIHIEKALTHLLISYTSGELPENGFKISSDFMKFARQMALDEKKDIDKHMALIEKLEQELVTAISTTTEEQTAVNIASQTQPLAVKVVT